MVRSGRTDRITEYIPPDTMLPAVGQGALCIEARETDTELLSRIRQIDHEETRIVVTGERAFLKRLEGGCQVPIAAMGRLTGNRLVLRGLVADVNGKRLLSDEVEGEAGEAADLGTKLAERLLESGASRILREIYHAPIEPVKR
jgi:hydroxymethylbilane synthase